jgi:L-asparaginase/Glu-tRNA(Gln) amidotransferase subunit D
MDEKTAILVIYTGGTIGMIKDPNSGALTPFNFGQIYDQMPLLKQLQLRNRFYFIRAPGRFEQYET